MADRVVVLALDQVMPFDLGIPARVLNEALNDGGRRLYDVVTCTIGGRPVRTNTDLLLASVHDEGALASADTAVVATQEPSRRMLEQGVNEPEVERALSLIRPDARVVSLCTSAFVLAAAGLLDGLTATTHWALAPAFERLFPRVTMDPDVLFVDSDRVLTGAGGAAGVDLFLHLIRCDHGAVVANSAARRCVAAPWRDGGQAQFIETPTPADTSTSTARTRAWALERLDEPMSLESLAEHALTSVRTLTRRFRAEVGMSPTQWLIAQRVERARIVLESTDIPVELVAGMVGLGSATLLRRHFAAFFGVSPQSYRRTFRSRPDELAATAPATVGGAT